MILIDFSQQMHQAVHSYFAYHNETITKDLLRHVILNNIFSLKHKIKDKSEMILCADGRNYWRKQLFPYYKQNRKLKPADPDGVNWKEVFSYMNELRDEFKTELPIKFLEVEECEADDIIFMLAMMNSQEPITIISSDKDFLQIQEYRKDVKQFSAIQNKWLDKKEYGSLFSKILSGDAGDGISNFLSDDDVFLVESKRQKPLTKKRIDGIINNIENYYKPEQFCNSIDEIERFNRNKKLIDLREIPQKYLDKISDEYFKLDVSKRKWFDYCVNHKLNNILENQSWR